MKCLSVKNPWAALIAAGRKPIELRTWTTSYRGPLVIVSSAAPDRAPAAKAWGPEWADAPRSRAVALVELVSIRPATVDDAERACCAVPGGYNAWELRLVRALNIDLHIRGQLSLFKPPAELLDIITPQRPGLFETLTPAEREAFGRIVRAAPPGPDADRLRALLDQHCTECDGNGYHVDDCPNCDAPKGDGHSIKNCPEGA